jgi:hypothetical protein
MFYKRTREHTEKEKRREGKKGERRVKGKERIKAYCPNLFPFLPCVGACPELLVEGWLYFYRRLKEK